MTQTRNKQTEDRSAELAIEPLSLELRTLTVNGKRMKPALLRQFLAEDLIDAQGPALRGKPLVWHTLHDKHCGDRPPHIHVLWQKGTVYRAALVVSQREQDERYGAMLARLEQRCLDLCDLLALILAQELRYETASIARDGGAHDRNQRRELKIGEYTLSLSPNVCYHLSCLEEARRIRNQDALAVAGEDREEVIKQAHLLLVHLYDQGIMLGHPTLDPHFQDAMILPIPLKSYGADEENDREESPRSQLRWDWRRGYKESGDAAAIGDELRTHELALLAAVSDRIVQQRLREVQEAAQSLIKALGVASSTPERSQKLLEGGIALLPLDAEVVWNLYEEEDKHLDGYPQAWEQLYNQLIALDQIFIDV